MLKIIIIISLFNTTLLLCLKKWGVIDWYTIHRKLWMPKAECYLCLGYWFSLIEILFWPDLTYEYLVVPFCSAALINYLVIHDYNR